MGKFKATSTQKTYQINNPEDVHLIHFLHSIRYSFSKPIEKNDTHLKKHSSDFSFPKSVNYFKRCCNFITKETKHGFKFKNH